MEANQPQPDAQPTTQPAPVETPPPTRPDRSPRSLLKALAPRQLHVGFLAAGLAVLFNLIALYYQARFEYLDTSWPARTAVQFWVYSIVLAGIAAGLYTDPDFPGRAWRGLRRLLFPTPKQRHKRAQRSFKRLRDGLDHAARLPLYSLLGIMALAFILRVVPLGINGIYVDEWYWLDSARSILSGHTITPFGFIGDQPANLPAFFVAFWLNLTHNAAFSVRFTGVCFSLTAILFVYLLARDLMGQRVAYIAALLYTLSAWDIHMDGYGWNNVSPNPMLVAVTLYLLYRVYRRRYTPLTLFALAAVLAVSLHLLYIAALLVIPATVVLIDTHLVHRRPRWRQELLLFLVFGWVCASPLIPKIIAHPDTTLGRHAGFFEQAVTSSEQTGAPALYYLGQAGQLVADFIQGADNFKRFGLWGITLEPLGVALLVLGILLALIQAIRRDVSPFWLVILLTLLTLLVIPLIILFRTSSVWRAFAILPLVYLLISLALSQTADFLHRQMDTQFNAPKGMGRILLGGLALVYLLATLPWYFHFLDTYLAWNRDSYENQICQSARDLIDAQVPPGSTVLMADELCFPLVSVQFDPQQYTFVPIQENFSPAGDLHKTYLVSLNAGRFAEGPYIPEYQAVVDRLIQDNAAQRISPPAGESPVLYSLP